MCWNRDIEFVRGRPWTRRGPQNPNDDFFIPDLVHFIIHFILSGGMTHSHISPTAPIYSMHILTYISKYAGECSCNLGLDKIQNIEYQPINTNQV